MADKISEYPAKTAFNNDDLIDISTSIEVGASYVSEKSTLLQIVDYIKTKIPTLYSADSTVGTGRVATLTDSLSFVKDAVTALFISEDFVGIGRTTPLDGEKFRVNGAVNCIDKTFLSTNGADGVVYSRDGDLRLYSTSTTGSQYGVSIFGSGSSPTQLHLSAKNDAIRGVGMGNISAGQLLYDLDIRGFSLDAIMRIKSNSGVSSNEIGKTSLMLSSPYWNGADTIEKDALITHEVPLNDNNGDSQLDFKIGVTTLFTLKGSGVLNSPNMPTSATGLVSGDIYSNSGVLTII